MMVHPSIERVLYGDRGILVGIRACIDARCLMSALTLIYSAIDAMGGLARPDNRAESNGTDFYAWVAKYYLRFLNATLSEQDLWGARCGIVHTYSPHSRKSRGGQARILIYRWRYDHRPDDKILAAYAAQTDITVIEIESLLEAFEKAVETFSAEIATSSALRKRVEHHVKALLCYEPWEPVRIVVPT